MSPSTARQARIRREAHTVTAMISLYCRAQHGGGEQCTECRELTDYASERLLKCPFGEGKTVCAKCPVHCYRPEMRERIRRVMRFSGPRMLRRHPVLAIWHLIDRRRDKPLRE